MQKINPILPFLSCIIVLLLSSCCREPDDLSNNLLPFPATYELKSVNITDGSYKLNADGEPEQIPHDSFFNQFAAPEYMYSELLNLLIDSLRFASEIDIRSNSELTLRGISLGLEEESMDLIYRHKGDSLTLRTNTGPISLVIHHEKSDSTLHMYICIYQYTTQNENTITPSTVSMVFVPGINSKDELLYFVKNEIVVRPENYIMVMFADYVYERKE
jgi:hypothetical protein